jgi:hypothetical protein
MRLRLIVLLILLVGLLVSSNVVFSSPPSPVRTNLFLHPEDPHVGDTLTVLCEVIPSRGATVEWAQAWVGGEPLPTVYRWIREFGSRGPAIIELTVQATTPGPYQANCWGVVHFGDEYPQASVWIDFEILP